MTEPHQHNKEQNVDTYRLVNADLITVKQAVTIALVDAGWPTPEARKVASGLRTTSAADSDEKPTSNGNGAPRKVRRQKHSNWTRWTDSERETLRQMWAEGTSVKEIADRLHRNPTQIQSALTRYGLYREHSRRKRAATALTPVPNA